MSAAFELRKLIGGYQLAQAIHVAAVLGIADRLADGPRSSDELGRATEADPDALYRLLRALACGGVLREEDGRRFSLTETGAALRRDRPDSLADWALVVQRPAHRAAWGALEHSIRTGENAFRFANGVDSWRYREAHPEESAEFDRAMAGLTRVVTGPLLDAFDF